MLSRIKRFLLGWAKRKPTEPPSFEDEALLIDRREALLLHLDKLDDIQARFARSPRREIELRLVQVGFVTSSDFARVRARRGGA